MTLRAWWARLWLPHVNARLQRTWREHDAAVTARRGCRRYVPEDDDPDDGPTRTAGLQRRGATEGAAVSGEAGAETGHPPIGEDDDVSRELGDTARLLAMKPREVLVRALRAYRQLHRFRANGDRLWVGQAKLYAEEWRWD